MLLSLLFAVIFETGIRMFYIKYLTMYNVDMHAGAIDKKERCVLCVSTGR